MAEGLINWIDRWGRLRDVWELVPDPARRKAKSALSWGITLVAAAVAAVVAWLFSLPWYGITAVCVFGSLATWTTLLLLFATIANVQMKLAGVEVHVYPCPRSGFSYNRAGDPAHWFNDECTATARVTTRRQLTRCSVKIRAIYVKLEGIGDDEWSLESQFTERYLCWYPEGRKPTQQRYVTVQPGSTGELVSVAKRGRDKQGLYFEITSADDGRRKRFAFGASYRLEMTLAADGLPEQDFVLVLGFAMRLEPPAPLNLRLIEEPTRSTRSKGGILPPAVRIGPCRGTDCRALSLMKKAG